MLGIAQIVAVLMVVAVSPLLWGITQTVKARLQGRHGPRLGQMYWVIAKTWTKETTVPEYSSWIFRLAPSIGLAAILLAALTIPVGGRVPAGWPHNLLTLFFLLALERFWVGLAGLDSAGTFGGLGASRVSTLGTGVEPALLAACGILWQVSGHTEIAPVASWFATRPLGALPWTLAAVSMGFVLLAEMGRVPVDNPDTHLELTMMHEATVLEYDGRLLALSQVAMTLKFSVVIVLGWVLLGPNLPSIWANLAIRAVEVVLTSVALGWIESRFSKIRYFQIPAYLSLAAGLGVLAFYLIAGG